MGFLVRDGKVMTRTIELILISFVFVGAVSLLLVRSVDTELGIGFTAFICVLFCPFFFLVFIGYRAAFGLSGGALILYGLVQFLRDFQGVTVWPTGDEKWALVLTGVRSLLFLIAGSRLISFILLKPRNSVAKVIRSILQTPEGPLHVHSFYVGDDMSEDILEYVKIEIPEGHRLVIELVGTLIKPQNLVFSPQLKRHIREGRFYIRTFTRRKFRWNRAQSLSRYLDDHIPEAFFQQALETVAASGEDDSLLFSADEITKGRDIKNDLNDEDTEEQGENQVWRVPQLINQMFSTGSETEIAISLQSHIQEALDLPFGEPVVSQGSATSFHAHAPLFNGRGEQGNLLLQVALDVLVVGGRKTTELEILDLLYGRWDGSFTGKSLNGPLVFLVREAAFVPDIAGGRVPRSGVKRSAA